MRSAYYATTAAISVLSVLANFLLVYIFVACPSRSMSSHKYFFFFTAMQDLLFSTCFLLMSPMALTREYTFLFLCAGPLRQWAGGMIFMGLFCFTTITTILFATNNFVYRYIQLCKAHLLHNYSPYTLLSIGGAFNIAISANWMAMIYFCLWPSDAFLRLSEDVWQNKSLLTARHSYIGISDRNGTNPLKLSLLIESLVMLLSLAQVNPYCAMEIHKCLKINSLSAQTKKLHRQMLKLLTVQTACPTLLMHFPLGSMYLLFFAGFESPTLLTYAIGILMATFPLSVPVTIILFMKEYRNFFLAKLGLAKFAARSIAPSMTVTATATKPLATVIN